MASAISSASIEIKPEPVAEQRLIRLDVLRCHFEVERVDQELSDLMLCGRVSTGGHRS